MDYAWLVWRGLCKLKEVNKSVMIYFGPHTKKAACIKKQGKLNFKIFKGSSNILLPYHFQSDEWLMPNKPCWQTFISFLQLCVLQWLQCYMTSEVQILFKILSRNIKMSADERLGHLQMLWEIKILTLAWSLHIFTDLLKIQQNTLHSWVWPYSAKQGRMPLFSKYLEFSWGKQYFSPPNYLQYTNSFSCETNLLSTNTIPLLPLLCINLLLTISVYLLSGVGTSKGWQWLWASRGPRLDWLDFLISSAQASQGWRWLTGSHITREARGGAQKWFGKKLLLKCLMLHICVLLGVWKLDTALNNWTHCIFIQLIALQHCITARQWHRYWQANVILDPLKMCSEELKSFMDLANSYASALHETVRILARPSWEWSLVPPVCRPFGAEVKWYFIVWACKCKM